MGVKREGDLLLKLSSTEKEGLFERGSLNSICDVSWTNWRETVSLFHLGPRDVKLIGRD